jgi:hypothetical protein
MTGLKQRKSTGKVSTDKTYSMGRYMIGPDMTFLKYDADSHFVHLEDVAVFSDGGADSVGVSFLIDVDFTFLLVKEDIGELHKDLAKNYMSVIESNVKSAIKNAASNIVFDYYFKERVLVEEIFKQAVRERVASENLHCVIDQFHIGRIMIPDSVAEKQLQARIQVETNDKETFLQQARVEREVTAVEVNKINLEKELTLKTAQAQANNIVARAVSEADQIKSDAVNTGTKTLLDTLGINNQVDSTAFTYIRSLQKRMDIDLTVSHLSDQNIVKTEAVVV